MARCVALVIGVGDVEGFRVLPDAREDARKFAKWASSQGFKVIEKIDDHTEVTIHDLRNVANDLHEEATTTRQIYKLFFYFAGHGVCDGDSDVLLLTRAKSDGHEAINLSRTINCSRACKIPHVGFFIDACRILPDVYAHGLPLFPGRLSQDKVYLDEFYAAYPGRPAHALRPDEDPASVGYGVYTECLLDALWGRALEAIRPTPGGEHPRAVVAESLDDYLGREVQRRAGKHRIVQVPQTEARSRWQPHVISWIPGGSASDEPAGELEGHAERSNDSDRRENDASHHEPPEMTSEIAANRSAIASAVDSMAHGMTIYLDGAQAKSAEVSRAGIADQFRSGESGWHIRAPHNKPGPIMLHLDKSWQKRSMWPALMVLPGYLTQVRVGLRGVEQLSFLKVDSDNQPDVLAWAVAYARWGGLISKNPRVVDMLYKTCNPTLAVLMAHAFHRQGEIGEIGRLLSHLRERRMPIPFDVALLGEGRFPHERDVFPNYPWMARGWNVLADTKYGGFEKAVRPYLAPEFWTTLLDPPRKLVEQLVHHDC